MCTTKSVKNRSRLRVLRDGKQFRDGSLRDSVSCLSKERCTESTEVVQVILRERLQQCVVEQVVSAPVPNCESAQMNKLIVRAPIHVTPPTKGNGAK